MVYLLYIDHTLRFFFKVTNELIIVVLFAYIHVVRDVSMALFDVKRL